MNASSQTLARAKGPSTLARAKFGPGMLLQHDDLEQLNVYTRELSRLMFRSLFGCGVVCGLGVTATEECNKVFVTVDRGVALDCEGDPIYVPKQQTIVLDRECIPNIPDVLWVVLCGTEKCCAPRTSICESDEDETPSICTRERDGFEIRVVGARPRCTCTCWNEKYEDPNYNKVLFDDPCLCANPELECHADHYAGKCGCSCGDCQDCKCDCVLLVRLAKSGKDDKPVWTPDHRARRFIRPVLMRDPLVKSEIDRQKAPAPALALEPAPAPAAPPGYDKSQSPPAKTPPASRTTARSRS